MAPGTFIINFKNYEEILGESSLRLARAAFEAARETGVEIIVAPPAPMLHSVASQGSGPVFSQRVDLGDQGRSTGAVIPESVKRAGCAGSLVNHSESRIAPQAIETLVAKLKSLGLSACVCAESADELGRFSSLSPQFLAIEPPELIGSGIAVSKARPELLDECVNAARDHGFAGKVLCGAGIVSADDVKAARARGMEGILVASAVVRAQDWKKKVLELANALA